MNEDLLKQIEEMANATSTELSEEIAELKKRYYEQIIKADELLNSEENIPDEELDSKYPDAALIDKLDNYIEVLKGQNEMLALENDFLKLQIKGYKAVKTYSDLGSKFSDKCMDIQEGMIDYQKRKLENQINKLEKYTKGTKKRSEDKQQQWAIAQKYFMEEIPKHKTLIKAREAAAQRAGIKATMRRLIEMLPVVK
ncbi:hypothetical protein [Methylobacter sp.]|uniref:hypothetical protein n=1 Tax=Methylobacter sp. TaxID=2051955 RepID=UPI002FDD9A03